MKICKWTRISVVTFYFQMCFCFCHMTFMFDMIIMTICNLRNYPNYASIMIIHQRASGE